MHMYTVHVHALYTILQNYSAEPYYGIILRNCIWNHITQLYHGCMLWKMSMEFYDGFVHYGIMLRNFVTDYIIELY